MLEAVIYGASIHCPRSIIPNFAELLVALVVRVPNETRQWVGELLVQVSDTRIGSRDRPGLKHFAFVLARVSWWEINPGSKEEVPGLTAEVCTSVSLDSLIIVLTNLIDLPSRIRTPKKMKEALNDYALVCRGLAGTVYGNAVVI